jgi:translation elongation factor EF-G
MNSTSQDAAKIINIYGHVSAAPDQIAKTFGGKVSTTVDGDCDLAIFAINPAAGIDAETISLWQGFDELQTPRLIVVTVIEGTELDFDDAVMLANRVFDQTVTPYLVLHGETGSPIGLISLAELTTVDYSTTPPTLGEADEELRQVVEDFREEYFAQIEGMEDGAFSAGILFPALPLNLANNLGVDLVHSYIKELPSRS